MTDKQNVVGEALGFNHSVILSQPERSTPTLKVLSASTLDEPEGYCPAECVTMTGESIDKLRDFLNAQRPAVPKNPDLIEMFSVLPGMEIRFSFPLKAESSEAYREEVRLNLNSFGKVFYERGYAVDSQIDQSKHSGASTLHVVVGHKQ